MIWICCFGSRERIPERWNNNINMTYVILLYFPLLPQDGGFQKMLVFDRTSLSPSYSGILQLSPQILPPFSLILMHMYCRSLLASTLDEYSRLLFSPFSLFVPSSRMTQPDGGAQEPEDPDDVSTWSSASRSS